MWARIQNNTVAETTDTDPTGRFHPSMQWVECPDDVKPGWHYDGESFFEPLGEPLTDLAQRKRRAIEADCDDAIARGFEHTFGDTTDIVQTRQRDRENIMGLAVSAQRNPDNTFAFRAQSNTTYELSADEVLALADAAQEHVSEQYRHSWERKEALDQALKDEDQETIETLK